MSTVSGTVTLGGSAVDGATIYVVNTDDDALEGTTTTDANGDYALSNVTGGVTVHVLVQYEDGSGTQYNAKSKPFVTTPESLTIVDSFEDQDLAEYEGVNSSNISFASDWATHGTYAVEFSGFSGTPQPISTSGLDNYPAQGDTIEVDIRTNNGSADVSGPNHTPGFMYGVTDTSNNYFVRVNVDTLALEIWVNDGGSLSRFVNESVSEWQAETVYRFQIQWTDPTHYITVFEPGEEFSPIGSGSGDDTSQSGTGVGFRVDHDQSSFESGYDRIHIP